MELKDKFQKKKKPRKPYSTQEEAFDFPKLCTPERNLLKVVFAGATAVAFSKPRERLLDIRSLLTVCERLRKKMG